MILIILNWIYILLTSLGMGYFLLTNLQKITGIKDKDNSLVFILLLGLIFITILCNTTSFFLPINNIARIVIFILSIIQIIFARTAIREVLSTEIIRISKMHFVSKLCFFSIILIALIKSTGPSELIDEGGYYLPYIRWIEDFKLTPGIANIEDRMGFNSSFHLLCAFYSFREWIKDGIYCLNGFMLILFTTYFIKGVDSLIKGKDENSISDYCMTFCLFFLLRNMLTSSACDLANVFLSEIVIIMFIEKLERKTISLPDNRFLLILFITVFLVTIKFSSIGLSLLTLYLLVNTFINYKRIFVISISISVIVISLWAIRSYFLSGYLIYPVQSIDLFNPDWKVPKDVATSQYYYVSEFAKTNADRTISEFNSKHNSLQVWLPVWFKRETVFNKVTAIVLLFSVLWSLILIFKLKEERKKFIILYLTLLINLLIWFFKFPAFRFGWAYIIIFISLIATISFIKTRVDKIYRYATLSIFICLTCQSLFKSFNESKNLITQAIIAPNPCPHPNTSDITFPGNIPIKVSESQECWGVAPPCFPSTYDKRIKLRGTLVQDGFYIPK